MSRILIIAGVVLVVLGVLLQVVPSIPFLGRLPGDIRIERPGFRFYFPLTSGLILSAVLSAILWIFTRNR